VKKSHKQVERLRVRIRDRDNKGNLVVGVYYRPPSHRSLLTKPFTPATGGFVLVPQLVLLGDFNHPNLCWKISKMSCRQSGRLPDCMDNNFLGQVIDSPTRGCAILDLLVTNTRELSGDVRIGGSLGCSGDTLVEFAVPRDMHQANSKVKTLNFRNAIFQLFESVNKTPWEIALRDRGAEQSWQIFKDAFHRVQELSVPSCKKSGEEGKRVETCWSN